MAPGVLRIRTACCSIIIPVRIALCVPLLVATLDAYSSPHPAAPTSSPHSTAPPLLNNTTPPNAAPDAPDGILPSAQLLPISAAETGEFSVISFPQGESRARALALTFCALAALLGLLSIISTWCSSDEHDPDPALETETQSDGTPMSVQAKEFAGRTSSDPDRHEAEAGKGVWGLFLGAATRLLLAALGTTAFIEVILERQRADSARSHNPGAFAAMMGLGWTLVATLYLGAFLRIVVLLCDPDVHVRQQQQEQHNGAGVASDGYAYGLWKRWRRSSNEKQADTVISERS